MSLATPAKKRPKNLNLATIRLPLPAIVSILHRFSGAALFLFGIPFLLWVLSCSLARQEGFDRWRDIFGNPLLKIILIGFLWAYLHHFCAGIRHLVMDLHIGLEIEAARATSYAVMGVSVALMAVIGMMLW